jgi:hypothetical protein
MLCRYWISYPLGNQDKKENLYMLNKNAVFKNIFDLQLVESAVMESPLYQTSKSR